MTGEKIKQVARLYDSELAEADIPSYRDRSESNLMHVRWMCEQIIGLVDTGRIEKAFRWLGFVQGCMWCFGCFTVRELANHSRPDSDNERQDHD